jgi:hypothetical protein
MPLHSYIRLRGMSMSSQLDLLLSTREVAADLVERF